MAKPRTRSTHIPRPTRRAVEARDAAFRCVYCIVGRHHVITLDHVVSERRNGPTTEDNLVKCCKLCNDDKGSVDVDLWAIQLERDTQGRLQADDTMARINHQLSLSTTKD